MDRNQISNKLQDIMRDVFDEDDLVISDETAAEDVADWDSGNHIRLIVAVEEAFGIMFEAKEINAPQSVGELIDLIASKL